ncbi:motility protein A [Rhodovibrionaceae bacterium A322]
MANVDRSVDSNEANSNRVVLKKAKLKLDYATMLGTFGGFALIIGAMIMGGSADSFVDLPALLIVFGGSFMVTCISYSLSEVSRAQKTFLHTVLYRPQDPSAAALQILTLADTARQKGALFLQHDLPALKFDPFLQKSIGLIVDGLPGDEVERILNREVDATMRRHIRSAGVLRRAGEVAPAMGLIGTLVGLVQMLGNLEDPTSIGPAMAVALLTTFYGAILANMIFLPLANKLERNSHEESQVKQIYAIGAASIGRQENPRRLEILLNSILSPEYRVQYFK